MCIQGKSSPKSESPKISQIVCLPNFETRPMPFLGRQERRLREGIPPSGIPVPNLTHSCQPLRFRNQFLPNVPTFAVRETDVSRHNGGTSGAPLKPLKDDSALRALSSLLQ